MTMKSALTRQEWLGVLAMGVDWSNFKMNRHQIAALALVEQPFGFTREDVTLLRKSANRFREDGSDYMSEVILSVAVRQDDLADRIEALLPPEG